MRLFLMVIVLLLLIGIVVSMFVVLPQPRALEQLEYLKYNQCVVSLCLAIDNYMKEHEGEIPTMEQLLEEAKELEVVNDSLKRVERSMSEPTNLLEAFDIVKLPACVVRDGIPRNSYVVIVKKPPVKDWNIVYVDAQPVHLRE